MRNFLRALKYAMPYRRRLVISVACALVAAIMWGLVFTAVYPTLTILGDKNLQTWVNDKINETNEQISDRLQELEPVYETKRQLALAPSNPQIEKYQRENSKKLTQLEEQLAQANRHHYYYRNAKKAIDAFLPESKFLTLVWVIGLLVLVVAIKGFFEFWQESLVGSIVNLSLFDLRNHFYRNVIHLDVNHFGAEGSHELMSRFTNDMELLGVGTRTLFGKMVAEPLRALSCVAVAWWISWQLTLLFLILVPVAVYILTKVGRLMKRATRSLLERMSNIYKILQESFQGIRVVKAFTMEPYERRRFRNATKEYYYKAMMIVNIDAVASPIIELLGVVAVAAAFLAGAYLVVEDKKSLFGLNMTSSTLEAASLLTLYLSLAAIADPVRKLSSVYTRLQSGAAAADRIFAYLDRTPRVHSNCYSPPLGRHAAAIEFRDICFSYDPGRPILTNIHLTVRAGETIAMVGKNGCGKTTMLGLIPRFYDPDHGSILIDDMDIRGVNLRSLRRQIGLVTQDTILFDDTIYNNISYGNRRASRDAVEQAAQKAFAHDFIVQLSHGYETCVGAAGAKLSGGQKQRIALARAILRDPSILILDEYTSQADVESEALIHKALKEFIRNRTTFVITHRLNTLEIADRIVVLSNGRIEAVGTHRELVQACATYQRLHDAQFQRLVA